MIVHAHHLLPCVQTYQTVNEGVNRNGGRTGAGHKGEAVSPSTYRQSKLKAMLASFSNSGRPIKWRRLVLLTPIFAAAAWAFIYFGGDWSTPQLALVAAFVGAAGFVGETLVLAWKRRPRFLRLDPLESVAYGAWMAPGTQALGSVWSNDPPDSTQIATLGLAVVYWAVFHELFFQIPASGIFA